MRIILSFGLAGFLLYKIIEESRVDLLAELNNSVWAWMILSIFLFGSAIGASFLRWHILLAAQGIELSAISIGRLGMIGLFFNCVVPGAVGGDVMKIVYISQHTGKKTAEAALTILIDRVIGLIGLLTVAAFVLMFVPFPKELSKVLQILIKLIVMATISGILMLFLLQFRRNLRAIPGLSWLIELIKRILPQKILAIVDRLVLALDVYRTKKRILLLALAISVGIHGINGLTFYTVGKAAQEHRVQLKQYMLATQISNAIAAIPIFPAGIGARDLVMANFLSLAGALKQKAAIIPLFFLSKP